VAIEPMLADECAKLKTWLSTIEAALSSTEEDIRILLQTRNSLEIRIDALIQEQEGEIATLKIRQKLSL